MELPKGPTETDRAELFNWLAFNEHLSEHIDASCRSLFEKGVEKDKLDPIELVPDTLRDLF